MTSIVNKNAKTEKAITAQSIRPVINIRLYFFIVVTTPLIFMHYFIDFTRSHIKMTAFDDVLESASVDTRP